MPRRRPRKVDRAGVYSADNMAVVMVMFFGHVGGDEQVVRDPGCGGASVLTSLKWSFEGQARGAFHRQRQRCLWVPLPSQGATVGTFFTLGL
jgi:hypothetical protein